LTHLWPGRANWTGQKFRAWYPNSLQRIIGIRKRDLQRERRLIGFAQRFKDRHSIPFPTESRSTYRITFKFTDEARRPKIWREIMANCSRRKTNTHTRKEALGCIRPLSSYEKITPLSLQRHMQNMPSWLLLLGQEQTQESQGSRQKDSNPPAWPRSEGMVFTSGLHQVAAVQSLAVKQVQLLTRRHDQTENVPHSLSFIEAEGNKWQ
jgi:hypothetical protein